MLDFYSIKSLKTSLISSGDSSQIFSPLEFENYNIRMKPFVNNLSPFKLSGLSISGKEKETISHNNCKFFKKKFSQKFLFL